MKQINIKIVLDEEIEKVAILKKMEGFNQKSIIDKFCILGLLESVVDEYKAQINKSRQELKK